MIDFPSLPDPPDPQDNQAALKAYADVDIERCFRIKTRSHKPLVFQCDSVSVKAAWMEALQDTIDKYASVMKRSIAPDQLQLACMTAEDFEKVGIETHK